MRISKKLGRRTNRNRKISIFLDSGAYSAFTKNININLQDYIDFIKEHKAYLEIYACLDVIGDPDATMRNQKEMERQGLNPLIVFHKKEPLKYLKLYLNKYDYIGLGGMAGTSSLKTVKLHLDRCWDIICNTPDRLPKVKIHGFGMTSFRMMRRYPWYSVDSTSWVLAGAFGSVYVPIFENGKYIYSKDPFKIIVSDKSPSSKNIDGYHIKSLSNENRKIVCNYFDYKGFVLGSNYSSGKVRLEGLCNSHIERDKANITYFLDFQNSLPKYPWAFNKGSMKSFGK